MVNSLKKRKLSPEALRQAAKEVARLAMRIDESLYQALKEINTPADLRQAAEASPELVQ